MEKEASNNKSKKGEESKVLAIISLVFGIVGIVSCWSGFFGLACCLAGLIIGIVALVKKQNKGMSIAGIVCGAVGLPVAIIVSILAGAFLSFFGGVANDLNAYTKDPEGFCKSNPNSVHCTSSDSNSNNNNNANNSSNNTDKVVDEVYDYFADMLGDEAELLPEDDFKASIKDFVVCLDKAGVKMESADDLEDIEDDDSNEEAAECYADFQDGIEGLLSDIYDL